MSTGLLLLVGLGGMLAGALTARIAPRMWLGATLAAAAAGLAAAVNVVSGSDWEWREGFAICGEEVFLRLDGLSALFLALLAVVGAAATIYASEYWPEAEHPRTARSGRQWWSLLLLSLAVVLLSSNGLHFLLAWEVFTVSGYFLITLDRQKAEARAAGWLYLGASHAAVLALFAFFSRLAACTGTWELGTLRESADPRLAPLFWLALFGFGLKAGVFPLHIWLPSAHASAPSHVSAILSGVTIKAGIYGLLRFTGWLPVPAAAGWIVATAGGVSAVLGVAFALGQHDLKRLLAYHSVENIGIILIGVGFALVAVGQEGAAWGRLALAGGLLHVWNHGLFKSLLFLGAGAVLHATGTREMSRLGGLWRAMPWTAGLFGLGAVAISGLPPLNGFVSEWLVYLGLFDAALAHGPAAWAALPAAIFLGVTGALALACFAKVCGIVFLGAPRSAAAERAHEAGPAMRGAMVLLAAACVLTGLAPVALVPLLERAMETWRPEWGTGVAAPLATLGSANAIVALLAVAGAGWLWRRSRRGGVERATTWDCGYVAPTARMQYTAGSFAGIVTEWFEWILRPVRHERRPVETLPASAEWASHTPETVLERAVEPASRRLVSWSLAVRRLQHGHVQSYLFYLVAGVLALAGLVIWGGGR